MRRRFVCEVAVQVYWLVCVRRLGLASSLDCSAPRGLACPRVIRVSASHPAQGARAGGR